MRYSLKRTGLNMFRNFFGDLRRVFNASLPESACSGSPVSGRVRPAVRTQLAFAFFILALTFGASGIIGQTPQSVERELVNHVKAIKKLAAENSADAAPKLDAENDALKTKLVKYGKLPAVLKHSFSDLKKEIFIATSKDGKFRIYSWDTLTGGTMHFYENVFQYQAANGRVNARAAVLDEADPGGFYHDIFQLAGKNGPIYIGRLTATLSTNDAYEEVSLFRIAGTKLDDDLRLFKTKAGMQNRIGYEYNFFSVVDRKERPIKLARFDERTNTILIPVVIADKASDGPGRVTKRFIKYRFNGTIFVPER